VFSRRLGNDQAAGEQPRTGAAATAGMPADLTVLTATEGWVVELSRLTAALPRDSRTFTPTAPTPMTWATRHEHSDPFPLGALPGGGRPRIGRGRGRYAQLGETAREMA
jgi:hypothetical protein